MTRAWVEVDLGALCRNGAPSRRAPACRSCRWSRPTRTASAPLRVARALEALDPWGFGVATVDRGRGAAPRRHHAADHRLHAAPPHRVRRAAPRRPHAGARRRRGDRVVGAHRRRPWHLAIDTGMTRAGMRWDEVDEHRDAARSARRPRACSRTSTRRSSTTARRDEQEQRFDEALAALPARPALVHAENSPAVERRAPSHVDARAAPASSSTASASGERRGIVPEPVVVAARAHRRAAHDRATARR